MIANGLLQKKHLSKLEQKHTVVDKLENLSVKEKELYVSSQ
jgi:hypothetical protein